MQMYEGENGLSIENCEEGASLSKKLCTGIVVWKRLSGGGGDTDTVSYSILLEIQ